LFVCLLFGYCDLINVSLSAKLSMGGNRVRDSRLRRAHKHTTCTYSHVYLLGEPERIVKAFHHLQRAWPSLSLTLNTNKSAFG
jgi:hypothetical protein